MSYVMDGKKPISVGPWGGDGGSQFDDGVYTGIRQLVVVHGAAAIDSIQIEYDKKGSSVWSDKHGGSEGTRTEKIKLDFPDEVLISVCGYYGLIYDESPVLVQSLTFESNQAKYGPYGLDEQGTYFSLPITGSKIVGFHGRCGRYLDSIGVYLKPLQKPYLSNSLLPSQIRYNVVGEKKDNKKVSSSRKSSDAKEFTSVETENMVVSFPSNTVKETPTNGDSVTNGPWGGNAGIMFDDGTYTGVRQVTLSYNIMGIVSIEVIYDRNGHTIRGCKHGGSHIINIKKIIFDYPREVLTRISGYHGRIWFDGEAVIQSLTFHTTKRKCGPIGVEHGIFFSSKLIKAGMIVGFHGRSGMYLNSIGVHVREGKLPPRGDDEGGPWDDSIFSGMKQIFITSGQSNINLHYKGASDFFDTNVSMTGTGNLYSLPSTQPARRGHT